MEVQWVDGTTDWLPLKDLKYSNPIETAEYAVSKKIADKPAFIWWVRDTLRRRGRLISKVKSQYWKRTHKYGIALPHSVKEAIKFDEQKGTGFWQEAIEKEMVNVMSAFEFRDDNKPPHGYKFIECHMIFDIKTDLTRKARLVTGGHMTEEPNKSVYSSVFSTDSAQIAFTIATLNGLKVLAGDVQNAYLNAPTKERCYTIAGPEFGANAGRLVVIVCGLYGFRSSGARWRDHMSSTLCPLGFKGCLTDSDVWLQHACKPDGTKYYEYVLIYVNDILVVSHDPEQVMKMLGEHYTQKKEG
jgi:Reverse transcriptase (RNA-dependent DNA polymerase)